MSLGATLDNHATGTARAPAPLPLHERYAERIYAGVLGKLIGVYLGRAVEGWHHEQIQRTFGEIDYYVNDRVHWPLIVPDDDLSGTFLFFRALEDNGFPPVMAADQVGDTWLNYIVEDKTVLWWGGLGRSSEHTAYLRLRSGIRAPRSGSIALNGRAMAEQIGAEIFIDTWAMCNPGDPERAAAMARSAASVSHDGVAVEAACVLAAMEAQAFVDTDIERLLDLGVSYTRHGALLRVIDEVRNQCAKTQDWRAVRAWLGEHHGYKRYPGNCPMVPNHALVLASFLLGGDDFQRGLKIAVTSGWDTDCNAGNLGCLNGIRLGLDGIDRGPDFRTPVADRLYVVNADGGECLSDAVIETRRIRRTVATLSGEDPGPSPARFAFEYPGSLQGFGPCPLHIGPQAVDRVGNLNAHENCNGLDIHYSALARGVQGAVSVATFIDPKPRGLSETSYFEVIASPSVYGTQTVRATIRGYDPNNPNVQFFIHHYDGDGDLVKVMSEPFQVLRDDNALSWRIPDIGGQPIYRIGLELSATERLSGHIGLLKMDWAGAPEALVLGSAFELSPRLSPWDTTTYWHKAFVSSARHFAPDVTATFCLSHPGLNGVITTGTREWGDYEVSSCLTLDLFSTVGVVARARGHRRYYAGVVHGERAALLKRYDEKLQVLAEVPYPVCENASLQFALEVRGATLAFSIEGRRLLEVRDSSLSSGGAGFLIEEGSVPARGFAVRGIN